MAEWFLMARPRRNSGSVGPAWSDRMLFRASLTGHRSDHVGGVRLGRFGEEERTGSGHGRLFCAEPVESRFQCDFQQLESHGPPRNRKNAWKPSFTNKADWSLMVSAGRRCGTDFDNLVWLLFDNGMRAEFRRATALVITWKCYC